MTDVTVTTEAPAPIRDQQGTLIDQSKPNTTPTPSEKPDDAAAVTPKPDAAPGETLAAAQTEGEADKPAEPEGAPEKYADFTAPEGYEIDKDAMVPMLEAFRAANLSQSAAQGILDQYWKMESARADSSAQAVLDMRAGWRGETQKLFGSGLQAATTEISRAIDTYLSPAEATSFREAMNFTGAGDHPAFIKAFHKLAQLVGEGTHVKGGNPSPAANPNTRPKSAAQALYPHLPSANGPG